MSNEQGMGGGQGVCPEYVMHRMSELCRHLEASESKLSSRLDRIDERLGHLDVLAVRLEERLKGFRVLHTLTSAGAGAGAGLLTAFVRALGGGS